MISHSICQSLRSILFPYPREGEIILAVTFEGKRSFLESFWQSLHCLRLRGELHHIGFQLSHVQPHASPIDICLSITVDQHTRVYAMYTLYRLPHRHEWSLWMVSDSHAHSKTLLLSFGSSREIEIILTILAYTVWSPHCIASILHPRHLVLRYDDTMVFPIRQIAG